MQGDIREAFGLEIEIEPKDYWVEYKIYKDGDLFIYGSVKWDGCSNWMFNSNAKNSMFHECSREGLERIGQILGQCWDWTKEFIPDHWDGV